MQAAWTPGVPELLLIAAVVLLLFGAKKVPEMARSLGKAQKEFKKGIADGEKEDPADSAAKAEATDEKSSD